MQFCRKDSYRKLKKDWVTALAQPLIRGVRSARRYHAEENSIVSRREKKPKIFLEFPFPSRPPQYPFLSAFK